jgi:hypothetical protein
MMEYEDFLRDYLKLVQDYMEYEAAFRQVILDCAEKHEAKNKCRPYREK